MASTAGLVPITRPYLAKYYDKYPYVSVKSDFFENEASLKKEIARLDEERLKAGGEKDFVQSLVVEPAHKIDENLWMNREQMEETTYLFDEAHWPASLKAQDTEAKQHISTVLKRLDANLKELFKKIGAFQTANSDRVYNMVLTYMPQDFRCTIIKQQRERSEKKRQAQVEALVNSGGSIKDKYALLWKQQMERRKQLADLGSASGVYKQLMKLLVGVPLVLLDFVRQINDHRGPMEEQRERYGPPLYRITTLSNYMRIFTTLWWKTFDAVDKSTTDLLNLLEKSMDAYVEEFNHYLTFMGEVFDHSPFLIKTEEAGLAPEKASDFTETSIAAGKSHEVSMQVDAEGSLVTWEFSLTAGKDVGFSVHFSPEGGSKFPIIPYQRYDLNQGDFYSPQVGRYTLVWDNTYSNFAKKTVRYKVEIVPNVIPQSDTSSVSSLEDEDTDEV